MGRLLPRAGSARREPGGGGGRGSCCCCCRWRPGRASSGVPSVPRCPQHHQGLSRESRPCPTGAAPLPSASLRGSQQHREVGAPVLPPLEALRWAPRPWWSPLHPSPRSPPHKPRVEALAAFCPPWTGRHRRRCSSGIWGGTVTPSPRSKDQRRSPPCVARGVQHG